MRPRILDLGAELVPYDRPRFGDYPAIVEDELTNPKYRLLYMRTDGSWVDPTSR